MHSRYRTTLLQQLRDQQVRFAPREKKLVQVDRAERLLVELKAETTYTYEYLFFRITGLRPGTSGNELISGEDAQHDVRLFIEDVSDAANVRVEEVPEPVRTVNQLGEMFNVSTKTISRWRQQGLVSRRFLFDGRKRVGFLQSSVDRFVANNRDRVERGSQFSQLTDNERDEIIYRARRLARAGGCPSDITRRIAERMNRSIETVRYTLKEFDRKHKDIAIFPNRTGPLADQAKEDIFRDYRMAKSVEMIAKRYCRTKASIYRIISEMRAKRIMELPLAYMPNDCFKRRNADKTILGPMPAADKPFRKVKVPAGLPPYLASLYEVPLLTREQEQHVFRKFNYLKYKASKLREKLNPVRPKSVIMDEIERLYDEVSAMKNQIVRANLRLVVSIAKRHVTPADNFFELVSDGNMSLIRAAEKFDYSRGNKFSTYASWAIMKNYARTIPGEYKYRDRFRTSQDEMFSAQEDDGTNPFMLENMQQMREAQIGKILSRLDDREQKIIISRFGLDHRKEPQTLKEVGAKLGVTKERIRQIEARALDKLRVAAREARIELP
jgi:RNA polymerase primary sigma factor/RNA polymerase sigma factor